MSQAQRNAGRPRRRRKNPPPLMLDRPVVLVGLMGAGKSSLGQRLADHLHVPFYDSDDEIVEAAGMHIPDIFELYGEKEFRRVEAKILDRLLDGEPKILATGGGAFMQDDVRALIHERSVSLWLRAELDTLVERTSLRPGDRPLLSAGDPAEILQKLIDVRYPVYGQSDLVMDTDGGKWKHLLNAAVDTLSAKFPRPPGITA